MFLDPEIVPRLTQITVCAELVWRWTAVLKFIEKVLRCRNVPTVVDILHFSMNSQLNDLAQCV